jgi:hypothetical protein
MYQTMFTKLTQLRPTSQGGNSPHRPLPADTPRPGGRCAAPATGVPARVRRARTGAAQHGSAGAGQAPEDGEGEDPPGVTREKASGKGSPWGDVSCRKTIEQPALNGPGRPIASWKTPDRPHPAWRDTSHARRFPLYSVVFRLLDLIQLGLDFRQCLEDLSPGFVLIL